ncbi:hypothetical protein [Methylobacterium nigriterrae]|uniref:hypothetical protein n=1 Tax=Methylobacterium nigriterrae TaxID=3127512 RepID=UPI003013B077
MCMVEELSVNSHPEMVEGSLTIRDHVRRQLQALFALRAPEVVPARLSGAGGSDDDGSDQEGDVKDRIGRSEMCARAETAALLALMTVGADLTEAGSRLRRIRDDLKDLRRQQWTLEAMMGTKL